MPRDNREALRGIRMTGDTKQKGGGKTREVVTDFADMSAGQRKRLSDNGYVVGEAPAATKAAKADTEESDAELSDLNFNDLRARAKEAGIEGYGKMNKAELAAALEGGETSTGE